MLTGCGGSSETATDVNGNVVSQGEPDEDEYDGGEEEDGGGHGGGNGQAAAAAAGANRDQSSASVDALTLDMGEGGGGGMAQSGGGGGHGAGGGKSGGMSEDESGYDGGEGEDEDEMGGYGTPSEYASGYNGGNGGGGIYPGAGGQAAAAASSRSDNVAMWTEDDFKSAAAERDKRVIPALTAYASAPTPNPDKVALWKAMLDALATGPVAATGSNGQYGGQSNGQQPRRSGRKGPGMPTMESPAGGGGSSNGRSAPMTQPAEGGEGEHEAAIFNPVGQNIASVEMFLLMTTIGQNSAAMSMQQRIGSEHASGNSSADMDSMGAPGAMGGSGSDSESMEGYEDPGDYEGSGGYGNGQPGYNPGGYNAGGQRGPASDVVVIAEAIVQHLVANGSPEADATVKEILCGKIPTGLPETETIGLVLKVLMANADGPDSKSQKLLSQILVTPEEVRPDDPETLHSAAMTMMTGLAASAVDSMFGLADAAGPGGPGGQRGPGGMPGGMPGMGMGEDEGGYNGGDEEAGMYAGGGGGRPSRGAPGRDDGGPSGGIGGGGGRPPVNAMKLNVEALSPEQLDKVVKLLWTPAFTGQIADRIRATNLTDNTEIFALAGALPSTSIRKAQYQSMQANHKQGAESLLSMGLFDGVARDPGLLVVLKSLPRPKVSASSSRNRNASQGAGDPVANSWLSATGHMVSSLKNRLHEAAMASGKTQLQGKPMIRLHAGASAPSAVFELSWPKDARSVVSDANPSPMRIHYVRINQTMGDRVIKKVVEHYRARTRGTKRDIPNGVWFDGTLKSTPTGGRISSDVVITQGNGGGGGYQGGGGEGGGGAIGSSYTIELIAVEIPDPKPTTKTAAR